MDKKMTIEEIAKELGVSKSTVSRALSGKGRIGKQTRDKIREYVERSGGDEKPQNVRTGNIAVVMPADGYHISMPFFQECLLGISEAAAMLQYYVLVVSGSLNDISCIQPLVEKRKVDGVILLRSVEDDRILRYLSEIGFPAGLAGLCDYEGIIQVDVDNRKASEGMVSLLIGQGYHRFAMVVGDTTYMVNERRCQGYFDALEKKGIPRNQQLFYPNFIHMERIDSIIGEMLNKKTECIVCGDDVIATRIMSRLQAEGYRIPRDISIVSLYNSSDLNCYSPAVTAVGISARQEGNLLGRQLIHKICGKAYEEKTILDYEILLRKSTGKCVR